MTMVKKAVVVAFWIAAALVSSFEMVLTLVENFFVRELAFSSE
jgi:hypothetical protein